MKTSIKTVLAATAIALASSAAYAEVKVENAWVRATVPNQQATGAFLNLTSDKDAKLVGASSSVLPNVEIHEMAMENDVMKMRQVTGIDLPAGQTVELKPGGYHIMFINLHNQVKVGQQVPLTLTFESADGQRSTLEVVAPVKPLSTPAGGQSHGGHNAHGHGSPHKQ